MIDIVRGRTAGDEGILRVRYPKAKYRVTRVYLIYLTVFL